MADVDPEEALYAESPDGFVAARDALAKQLREAGDRAGARRVRALRRPTRAAWAINVAVRERPGAARELADAAGDLGGAQRDLLAGGSAASLREAQARVDAAGEALLTALPVADAPTLEKVRQTLRAAAVDPDALADVVSGRLLRERVASGFGDLGGFAPTPPTTAPDDATAAAEHATRDAEQARAAKEAADRAAAKRQARLDRAREQESAAEAAAVAARDALRQAETAVVAAREALQQAEAGVAGRRADVDDAEARLAEAAREREQAEAG